MSSKAGFKRIDHLAIAVKDLEEAIDYYGDVLGLEFVERRETVGSMSGMISAVFRAAEFDIVLMQGMDENSQINRYINKYGAGVQHVAFEVDNLNEAVGELKETGLDFSTDVIDGGSLRQIFSRRQENCGMMIEIIERNGVVGFKEESINQLFNQLERREAF